MAIGMSDLFILMPFFNSEDINNSLEGYGTLAVHLPAGAMTLDRTFDRR